MESSYPTEFGSLKVTEKGYNFTPVYVKLQNRHFLYYLANSDGYSSLYRIEISPEYFPIDSPELVLRGEQTAAVERGLGKREIVKDLERHRIGWRVRVELP